MRWSIILIGLLLLLFQQTKAQTTNLPNGFTFKFVANDHITLNPKQNDNVLNPDDYNYALELGYFRSLHPQFSVGTVLRVGSIDSYHLLRVEGDSTCQPCDVRKRLELFAGLDVLGVYKFANDWLLLQDFVVAPYVLIGLGGRYLTERQGHFDLQIPMGVGVNFRLREAFYLQVQMEYRQSLIVQKNAFEISGGIFYLIDFKNKEKNE